ncbi:Hypothetical predicted protein, partial [Paramuricea clavata]
PALLVEIELLSHTDLSFNIVTENRHIKANESQFDVRNSMEGRPRLKETELHGENDARAELTAKAHMLLVHMVQQTSPSNDDKRKKIVGLLAVLDALQCKHIGVDGKAYNNSFLRFEEAMELFFAHHNNDEGWGLCVYIVFIHSLICYPRPSSMLEGTLQLHAENGHEILATVDTEWDRKVAQVLLASERSRSKISELGIDPDNIMGQIH